MVFGKKSSEEVALALSTAGNSVDDECSSCSSSGGANTSGISNTSSDPIAAPATPGGGVADTWTTTPKTEPPLPPMARSFLNFEPHSASTPVGAGGSSLGGLHHQAGLGGVNHQFNPHHHLGDGGGISPLTAHHSAVFAASHHQMAAADAAAVGSPAKDASPAKGKKGACT